MLGEKWEELKSDAAMLGWRRRVSVERFTDAETRAKTKYRDPSPFDFAQGQDDDVNRDGFLEAEVEAGSGLDGGGVFLNGEVVLVEVGREIELLPEQAADAEVLGDLLFYADVVVIDASWLVLESLTAA